MEINLKPCPFCGGAADLVTNWSDRAKARFYWVECDTCGGRGATKSEAEWNPQTPCFDGLIALKAARAWNRRTEGGKSE